MGETTKGPSERTAATTDRSGATFAEAPERARREGWSRTSRAFPIAVHARPAGMNLIEPLPGFAPYFTASSGCEI